MTRGKNQKRKLGKRIYKIKTCDQHKEKCNRLLSKYMRKLKGHIAVLDGKTCLSVQALIKAGLSAKNLTVVEKHPNVNYHSAKKLGVNHHTMEISNYYKSHKSIKGIHGGAYFDFTGNVRSFMEFKKSIGFLSKRKCAKK